MGNPLYGSPKEDSFDCTRDQPRPKNPRGLLAKPEKYKSMALGKSPPLARTPPRVPRPLSTAMTTALHASASNDSPPKGEKKRTQDRHKPVAPPVPRPPRLYSTTLLPGREAEPAQSIVTSDMQGLGDSIKKHDDAFRLFEEEGQPKLNGVSRATGLTTSVETAHADSTTATTAAIVDLPRPVRGPQRPARPVRRVAEQHSEASMEAAVPG